MSLTKKQMKTALKRVKKDLKVKKGKRSKPARSTATVVLAQGTAALPRSSFGSKVSGKRQNVGSLVKCLDARLPRTLGLPRAVGPYTVIRTSTIISSSARVIMFAPFMRESSSGKQWFNWCGVADVDTNLPVNGASNTTPITMPVDALGGAAEVVPAALTVQVMNPASLQNAAGMFAMGRVNQQLQIGGSTETWHAWKDRLVSFQSLRMMSGGKLALRGVKCSAAPLNMTEYADFASLYQTDGTNVTWTNFMQPSALTPIVFLHANEATLNMEFMVTIEWRVRFDPSHPASASHTHHDTLSDEAWNNVSRAMAYAGHGVEELSEDVSEAGAMGYGAFRALQGAAAVL